MIQISLKADHERPAGETTFSFFFIFAIFQGGGGEGPDLQPHIYIYIPKNIPTYIHVHTCMYILACTYIHVYTYVYSCAKTKGNTLVHKECTRFKLGVHY